jgi:hypothetical protein
VFGAYRNWQQNRDRRALRRRRTEEILGWICVPLLVLLGWQIWVAIDTELASRGPPGGNGTPGEVRQIR